MEMIWFDFKEFIERHTWTLAKTYAISRKGAGSFC